MAKMKITDKDKGWKKIVSDYRKIANSPFVKVGVIGSAAESVHKSESNESINVATIATIHEFGSESRGIPERSFIRGTIEAYRPTIVGFIEKLSRAIIFQRMDASRGLGLLGLEAIKLIKNRITVERIPPPLKPETIKQKTRDGKAGDTPLVDTAQMLNSVRHEVVVDGRKE